jgi:type VI secretion system secreted protein Hcp
MITKVFDRSSPLIAGALVTGEIMSQFRLELYRQSGSDAQLFYTIELEDALIVDVQSRMPHCQDPSQAYLTTYEDVYFTYRKITWTHVISGTSNSDDWRSPKTS